MILSWCQHFPSRKNTKKMRHDNVQIIRVRALYYRKSGEKQKQQLLHQVSSQKLTKYSFLINIEEKKGGRYFFPE